MAAMVLNSYEASRMGWQWRGGKAIYWHTIQKEFSHCPLVLCRVSLLQLTRVRTRLSVCLSICRVFSYTTFSAVRSSSQLRMRKRKRGLGEGRLIDVHLTLECMEVLAHQDVMAFHVFTRTKASSVFLCSMRYRAHIPQK